MNIYNKNKIKKKIYNKILYDEFKYGINKNIIIKIWKKKLEPLWMLKTRLKAYKLWKKNKNKEPKWFNGSYNKINFNKYKYYTKTIISNKYIHNILKNLKLIKKNIGIDAIINSNSINTSYENKLLKLGIIFCSFNKAILKYSNLIKKYMCKIVPINDNFYATLNTCIFSDGTFIYIPKNTICPIPLSSFFRINKNNLGQFERTLIILNENSSLNYTEGCTALFKKKNQLHSAVVEIIIKRNANIKFTTLQNWFSGNKKNKKGILNFVTKRALCEGINSKITWIQIEKGSYINWKYPTTILKGNNSKSNFYSISITKKNQQSDTGSKIIHIGKNTKSLVITKNIAYENSQNTNRNLIKINKNAFNSYNYTKCDSLIFNTNSKIYTLPTIYNKNKNSIIEHEASSYNINKKQLFYLKCRGIKKTHALSLLINGFCENIINILPLEIHTEIKNLFN